MASILLTTIVWEIGIYRLIGDERVGAGLDDEMEVGVEGV
jgi:hypothetical protein